jgi:catechol 2,3-dioxygenase-like lactoylglutathione lyase family enzyme
MLGKIKQIAVAVADLDASKAFYGEKLGIKLAFEVPGQLVFFDLAGIWLMLSVASEREPAQPGSVLYFEVDDINAAYAELQERGVGFLGEPHKIADMGSYELWMAFFRDPDNTALAIRAEVTK